MAVPLKPKVWVILQCMYREDLALSSPVPILVAVYTTKTTAVHGNHPLGDPTAHGTDAQQHRQLKPAIDISRPRGTCRTLRQLAAENIRTVFQMPRRLHEG